MSRRLPLVLELVGPAGAGKTTLAEALRACDQRVSPALGLWGLPRRLLLRSAPGLIRPGVAAARAGHPLGPPEFAQMLRLMALHRAVGQAAAARPGMVVLDEGPVFGLAWLQLNFGRNGDPGWAEWRRRTIAEWAPTLNVVVRIDAPDPVLVRRIRTRSKPHPVKHSPEPEIRRFTLDFRRAFDTVIADLAGQSRLRVIAADGDAGSAPEDTAVRLLALLEALHGR